MQNYRQINEWSLRTNMEYTIIILFLWYWRKDKEMLDGMWKERNIMISFPLIRR